VQWFYPINISHPNQTSFTRVHHLIPTEPRLVLVAAMESMPRALAATEGKRTKRSFTRTMRGRASNFACARM
jgi:hypothetical protein